MKIAFFPLFTHVVLYIYQEPEVAEDGDSSAASFEHSITIVERSTNERSQSQNISMIVQEKDLQMLRAFGDLRSVADALKTDLRKGISDTEANNRNRWKAISDNTTFAQRLSKVVMKAIKNKTIFLLSLGAALSVGFGIKEEGLENGWFDGVVVLITIIVLVLFTSVHEYWQERKARRKLKRQCIPEGGAKEVNVIREGVPKWISESELVYGDVVLLKKDYQVLAYGLFVDGKDLKLDNGSESDKIDAQNPFLSYGDRVIDGDARMVVTSTDTNTGCSEMMRKAASDLDRRFKLEACLDRLNACIHDTGHIISILMLVVLFLRYMVGKLDEENGYRIEPKAEPAAMGNFANSFKKILVTKYTARALTKLLSVSLIGILEAIPFVISLAILYWNDKTLSGKATEQVAHAVVKMALVTRYCTDKFGDFTGDEMEVDKLYIGRAAIETCREHRVEIVIVSREKKSVLQKIALECGLITNDDFEASVLTGEVFRKFTDKERAEKVDKIRIMGEALPSDKLLLVETLREKGEVVVFLGQRTDDAPALRGADIGIAMGTGSSKKARESSDVIIWDGSFDDVISIVNSGKCIYGNIQKFLQLVLIMTISSTLINFSGTVVSGDAPLTAVQLVWVNLAVPFLGGFGLLTISLTDKPVSLVPITYGRSLVTADMKRNILAQVAYQATCLVILQAKGSRFMGTSQNDMKFLVFNSFILCQFFNQFNARELQKKNFFKGIHRHKGLWVAVAIFIVLQTAFVMVQDILGFGTILNWKQWVGCVLIGAGSWLVDWLGKCMHLAVKTFAS